MVGVRGVTTVRAVAAWRSGYVERGGLEVPVMVVSSSVGEGEVVTVSVSFILTVMLENNGDGMVLFEAFFGCRVRDPKDCDL